MFTLTKETEFSWIIIIISSIWEKQAIPSSIIIYECRSVKMTNK